MRSRHDPAYLAHRIRTEAAPAVSAMLNGDDWPENPLPPGLSKQDKLFVLTSGLMGLVVVAVLALLHNLDAIERIVR